MPGYLDDPRTDPAMRAARLAYDQALAAALPDPPAVPDARMRAAMEAVRRAMPLAHPDDATVELQALDAPGRPRLSIFRPKGTGASAPAMLWLHGGGWCTGSLVTHGGALRAIARQSGLNILGLEYRLAPEHPFPAALEDAEAALGRIVRDGAGWGIDPSRLLLGGDSAGANIALSLALSQAGRLRGLVLVYPVTDSDLETDSYREFAEGFTLTRAGMAAYWNFYARGARTDPRAAPIRSASLAHLPPVHLQVAGLDVLRDDGLRLEARLRAQGVPVTTQIWPSLLHAYLAFGAEVPHAAEAIALVAAWARARAMAG
jgi:acetyl esterase